MTKQEYLSQLMQALAKYDPSVREEIIADYNEHFDIGASEGKSEEEIISSLGDIKELLDGLGEPERIFESQEPKTSPTVSGKVRKLVVEAYCADVRIARSKDNNIHANYENLGTTREKLAYQFQGRQEGDTFILNLSQIDKRSFFFGIINPPQMYIDIEIPNALELVQVKTLSGDMDVRNIEVKDLRFQSASGDIVIVNSSIDKGMVDVASGDVDLLDCKGSYFMKTASGDITIKRHDGNQVSVSTASGDIDYDGRCDYIDVKTASGDIDIKPSKDAEGKISTVSGDCSVHLPEHTTGLNIRFSSISGSIHSKHPDFNINGLSGNYCFGNGTMLVINSVSGDVTIY